MKNKTLMLGIAILTLAVNLSFAQVPVQTTPTPNNPNSTEKQDDNGRRKGEGKRKNGGKKNKEGNQTEKEDNDDDKKGNYDRRDSKDSNEGDKNDNGGQKRENKVNTPEVRAAKMTERMTRQLGLEEVTAKNVNAIALERAVKVDAINSSTDDNQTKQAAFVANKQDFEAKLKGVLSADQFTKYQTMENGGGSRGDSENRGNRGNNKSKKEIRGSKNKGD